MADFAHQLSQQPIEFDHLVTQSPGSVPSYPEYHFLSQDQDLSMQRPDMATFDLSSEPHLDSPMFSLMQPSHLPTPQSPNTLGQYAISQYILDSPISHLQSTFGLSSQTVSSRTPYKIPEEFELHSPSPLPHILTPESSPQFFRGISPSRMISAPQFGPLPFAEETPRASSPGVETDVEGTRRPSRSLSAPVVETAKASPLSSPFMAKLSLSDASKSKKSQSPSTDDPVQVDDVFYSGANPAISTPPLSPSPDHPQPGGELERVRSQIVDEAMAQIEQAENRRPDYFKRVKRTQEFQTDDERDHPLPGVEITVSPHKGRRLTLFQETSEESFEESLMAGGYGRYRTMDWSRRSQVTSSDANASIVVSTPEAEQIPTPKELKKRKRLAAFQERPAASAPAVKLSPVKLGNQGRVLLDISAEAPESVKQLSPTKKRGSRRKNMANHTSDSRDRERPVVPDRPNWPDSEFPWRLRLEERAEMAKAEEAERLRWIEKFLDRDSDEEDELEEDLSIAWNDEVRVGRGKMVPLAVDPAAPNTSPRPRRAFHPSDPADARVALMSKRSVRALKHRKEVREARRRNDGDESNDEAVCICQGQDDGRGLVQCDQCLVWYHLHCIGIKDVAELGREEDPWYCDECSKAGLLRAPSPTSSEPTFVKTNEEPTASLPFDNLPFFQSLSQDSPAGPWNPQPPSTHGYTNHFGSGLFSADMTWNDAKYAPSTPKVLTHGSRLYATPGPIEPFQYDDAPFDPMSTPSRGIRLGQSSSSFATPKNNTWLTRANGLFHTPSKTGPTLTGPGLGDSLLSSSSEDHGPTGQLDGGHHLPGIDDSPVRRTTSVGGAGAGDGLDRVSLLQRFGGLRSPSPSVRPLLAQPFSVMDDWKTPESSPPNTAALTPGVLAVVQEVSTGLPD